MPLKMILVDVYGQKTKKHARVFSIFERGIFHHNLGTELKFQW